MKDIRVPATKKKSAVTKVTALFLFPSFSLPSVLLRGLILNFSIIDGSGNQIGRFSKYYHHEG
jgi:hypothetical protein